MGKEQLSVRLHGISVGTLEQTSLGSMQFSYDGTATKAISLAMPIRERPYDEFSCEAFFGGLLPENETTRRSLAKLLGVNHADNFGLLKAIGYDCAGAISFHEIDEPIAPTLSLRAKIVTEQNLYQRIQTLPNKPLFIGFEGLGLSLAGIQNKAAVCLIHNQIAIPTQGCPTTHILKPATPEFEGIVENEYFCLHMAAKMGLPVPQAEIQHINDIRYLLIERFDRRAQKNQIQRIHQEDFCQALGIITGKKYQPGFKECFHLLEKTAQPAVNRKMLMDVIIFNYLIGNMAAHSKNFAFLHDDNGQLRLAPFYDLICTRIYPNWPEKMAMKIADQSQVERVQLQHWQQFCKEVGYAFPALKRLLKQQGEKLLALMELHKDSFSEITQNPIIINKIVTTVKKHIEKILLQVGS